MFCVCALSAGAADVETYKSNETDFTLKYSGTWEKKERTSGAAVTLLAPKGDGKEAFRANLTVIEQDIPSDTDLKKFSDGSLSVMDKLLKGYKELERKEISIGAVKAIQVVYTYAFEDFELKSVLVLAVSGKHGYAITAAAEAPAFDKYKPAFDEIVKSFEPH